MKAFWSMIICLLLLGVGIFVFQKSSGGKTQTEIGHYGELALKHTRNILEFGPRPPESAALDQTRSYLASELSKDGWKVEPQTFSRFTPAGRKSFTNLIARFGKDSPPKDDDIRILLAAHIDSKLIKEFEFLGADDAASAAGAILVIAKKLRQTPELARQIELIFFDGEEALGTYMTPKDGLYGSRYYASQWRAKKQKPTAGILLDMIGHKDLTIKVPSDSPRELYALMMDSAQQEKVEQHFSKANITIMDDHLPINQAGIPMIDLIGDFQNFSWWHKKEDDGSNLSSESLDKSIRVVLRMLNSLGSQEKTLEK